MITCIFSLLQLLLAENDDFQMENLDVFLFFFFFLFLFWLKAQILGTRKNRAVLTSTYNLCF